MRLLPLQALGLALEQADVVRVEAGEVEARSSLHGVPHDGVERESIREVLLHESQAYERRETRARSLARQARDRVDVDVIAAGVREHGEHASTLERKATPAPVDEKRDLGDVVLVIERAYAGRGPLLRDRDPAPSPWTRVTR